MAKTPAAVVAVGEREVRVSSPDRVVYEATERTPAITKLDVCQYFASVGEPLMRALGERPTAMERWPDGWREGMRLATGPQDRDGDGFYQKRLPKGAPDFVETVEITFPSGRTAAELCPTEPASLVWAAQMGALTFHPWPVRRPDVDHPDELRLDLDPQPGTTFADARRVADVARELLEELGLRGYAKTSGNRGVHIYVRIQPDPHLRGRPARRHRLRPRAGASRRRRDHRVVEGGARAAHLPGLQPEQPGPDHRQRLESAGPTRVRRSARR